MLHLPKHRKSKFITGIIIIIRGRTNMTSYRFLQLQTPPPLPLRCHTHKSFSKLHDVIQNPRGRTPSLSPSVCRHIGTAPYTLNKRSLFWTTFPEKILWETISKHATAFPLPGIQFKMFPHTSHWDAVLILRKILEFRYLVAQNRELLFLSSLGVET